MCRWMAWTGQRVRLAELLLDPAHGIVDQSLHADLGAEPTNGDGFGVGWYDDAGAPALYRNIAPAWSDENLRELAAHVEASHFLAHVRAAIGSPVQQTNCHPFRHGRWLLVHNGYVDAWDTLRRDLLLAVEPGLFRSIVGTTDSEVLFALALGFGLEDDPLPALERAVGLIEATARRHGLEPLVHASIGVSDGEHLWAVRYATSGTPRSLFASEDAETVRRLYPDSERLRRLAPSDRLIVSEPLSDLPGAWREVAPGTALAVARDGHLDERPFTPTAPAAPPPATAAAA